VVLPGTIHVVPFTSLAPRAIIERVFDTSADGLLDELRDAAAARDAALTRVAFAVADAVVVGAFEAAGLWSARRWMRTYTESSPDDARRAVAVGRHFALHPATRAAVETGRLSIARAVAIATVVTDARRRRFRDDEATLLDACGMVHCVEDAEVVMARWAATVDQDVAPSDPCDQRLFLHNRLDGGAMVRGELDPETAAVVNAGLDACDGGPDPVVGPLPPRSFAERRADAWGDMARHVLNRALGREDAPTPSAEPSATGGADTVEGHSQPVDDEAATASHEHVPPLRPSRTVNLTLNAGALTGDAVDQATAVATIDGRPVLASAIERLLCDSWLAAVLLDANGAVVDATTRTAEFTETQRRLIAVRDRHCVFPGCTMPASMSDIHHLHHRADGGGRSLDNGVLCCRRHHTLLHRRWPGGRRWTLHRSDDGTGWHATSPTGVTWTGRPDDPADHVDPGGREPPDHRTAA
jgi:hypothetical protein